MSEVAAVARSRRVCVRAFSAVCAAGVSAAAVLAAAVVVLEARPAAALGYSASDADAPRAPRKGHGKRAKSAADAKPNETVSLARPLFAVVSLGGQHISIYNHNGLVDRSTISTGVPGHPTPEGMFTILGRERFHRSNLYSGAPMPFMQRITWSGVAMHTGHVTGHPASHGCIRLPGAFAQKLWGMTRIGERVVIAPYDLSPTEISHPALPAPQDALADGSLGRDARRRRAARRLRRWRLGSAAQSAALRRAAENQGRGRCGGRLQSGDRSLARAERQAAGGRARLSRAEIRRSGGDRRPRQGRNRRQGRADRRRQTAGCRDRQAGTADQ